MGPPLVGVGPWWGPLQKKAPFFFARAPPLAHSDEGWSHSQAIGACPLPFSFASVRARTQDLRDILKWGALSLPTEPFFVRAPPPGPLRRGVVPLTGYRGMSHALFFRLRESSNPRPKGHIEMGSTLTTNWATSSVGSESAPHFNMYLWSWVRALTEAKEKGMGHAPIAYEWDHPSSEWARGWGPYTNSWAQTTISIININHVP